LILISGTKAAGLAPAAFFVGGAIRRLRPETLVPEKC